MGEAGHISAQFRRALDKGNFESARMLAFEMPRVELEEAMLLTVLAAEAGSERFDRMARRCIARLAEEARPPLCDLAIAVRVLASVSEGELVPSKAREPLIRCVRGQRLG